MFFNALRSKPSPPLCRPLEEQEERESQKLWFKTAQAVIDRNHELATDEKTKVEEQQREEAALRANDSIEWRPRLFRAVKGGPGGSEEGEEDLEWIINAQMFVVTTPDKRKDADTTQRWDHAREAGRADYGDIPHCQRPTVGTQARHSPADTHPTSPSGGRQPSRCERRASFPPAERHRTSRARDPQGKTAYRFVAS